MPDAQKRIPLLSTEPRSGRSLREAIERRLNYADIASLCRLILLIYALMMAAAFYSHREGRTVFGPQLGADFAAFYVAGRIYREVAPAAIYDRPTQRKYYQEFCPTAAGEEQPYVNAPFFALPLPWLARLPYAWAYLVWLGLSLALFGVGLRQLLRLTDAIPAESRTAAILLAVSFMPFLVECLAGGQTSAVGFFALATAIALERRGRPILSGAALALCAYKPTLLVLIVPMLLLTRRTRTIAGMAIGGLGLGLLSFAAVGWEGCARYVRMLLFFADHSTSNATGLKSWKYVDVNSFARLLFPHSSLRWLLVGAAVAAILPWLIRAWLRADRSRESAQRLAWAATITWTLVLNIYLGIYDVTMLVIAAFLATDVLLRDAAPARASMPDGHRWMLLALYVVPWVTQPLAKATGLQLLTLLLAAFGLRLLALLRQGNARPRIEETELEPAMSG